MVMKEHVTQCNSVAHWCAFNGLWNGTDKEDMSDFDTHTALVNYNQILINMFSILFKIVLYLSLFYCSLPY